MVFASLISAMFVNKAHENHAFYKNIYNNWSYPIALSTYLENIEERVKNENN